MLTFTLDSKRIEEAVIAAIVLNVQIQTSSTVCRVLRAVMQEEAEKIVRSVDFKPHIIEAIRTQMQLTLPGMDFGGEAFNDFIRRQVEKRINLIFPEED